MTSKLAIEDLQPVPMSELQSLLARFGRSEDPRVRMATTFLLGRIGLSPEVAALIKVIGLRKNQDEVFKQLLLAAMPEDKQELASKIMEAKDVAELESLLRS